MGHLDSNDLRAWIEEAHKKNEREHMKGSSSVLIPLLEKEGVWHVLYEVRSAKLRTQPGEICFPGGRIEEGETPLETAVREAVEELLIREDQIEIVGALDKTAGPGSASLYAFIGVLTGYEGTMSPDEVDRVFTIPLDWILKHEPEVYRIQLDRKFPEDFPFAYVPGGRSYHWRSQKYNVPFYPEAAGIIQDYRKDGSEAASNGPETASASGGPEGSSGGPEAVSDGAEAAQTSLPVLWGATARVTYSLAKLLRAVR